MGVANAKVSVTPKEPPDCVEESKISIGRMPEKNEKGAIAICQACPKVEESYLRSQSFQALALAPLSNLEPFGTVVVGVLEEATWFRV